MKFQKSLNPKCVKLNFRVTAGDNDKIRARAEKLKFNLTDYIETLLLQDISNEQPISVEGQKEIADLKNQITLLQSKLKQAPAPVMKTGGNVEKEKQHEKEIAELKAEIIKLKQTPVPGNTEKVIAEIKAKNDNLIKSVSRLESLNKELRLENDELRNMDGMKEKLDFAYQSRKLEKAIEERDLERYEHERTKYKLDVCYKERRDIAKELHLAQSEDGRLTGLEYRDKVKKLEESLAEYMDKYKTAHKNFITELHKNYKLKHLKPKE